MTTRPRHSVLSLFDPLAPTDGPETPPRDSQDSDKENSGPLSAFFNRTYKQQPCLAVTLPKKRLVDVGDTTLEEVPALDLLIDEQVRDEPDGAPQPRSPLAELTLVDSTPLSQTRALYHQHTQVLDGGLSTSLTHRMADDTIQTPEIIISPCHLVDSSPDRLAQRNSDADLPPPLSLEPVQVESFTHSTLRLQTPSIASYSNRVSVDLQASFQLHFQSDASFDLLNDRISLMEPMECLVTDDDNFDFEVEKEKLRDALAKFKRGTTPSKISPSRDGTINCEPLSQEASNSKQRTRDGTLDSRDGHQPLLCLPSSPQEDKTDKRQSIPSQLPSSTSHRGISPVPSEEVPSAIPQAKQRRMSIPLATPRRLYSVAPPPPVPALRIVKRAKVHHLKSESASIPYASSEQERPHASSMSSKQATTEEITLTLSGPSVAQPTTKSSIARSHGPRRVPVTVTDNPVTVKSNQTSLPLGPRRVPIGSTVVSSRPSLITTGLKPPTRLESTMSSLARPGGRAGSRLPGPTVGTSKLRKPTGGLPRRVE